MQNTHKPKLKLNMEKYKIHFLVRRKTQDKYKAKIHEERTRETFFFVFFLTYILI